MAETITKVRQSKITKIKEPGKYKVVIYNDDKTPMDFVIALFVSVFRHTEAAAIDLTMKIHNEGSAIGGVYSYEIAEQKGVEATTLVKHHGHPLAIRVEPE